MVLLLAAAPLASCDRGPAEVRPPRLLSADLVPNPTNALSVVVRYVADAADSARLMFWGGGDSAATPYAQSRDGAGELAALGLAPHTVYHGRLEMAGPGGVVAESVAFSSSDLPSPLQDVRLDLTGSPPAGLLLTGVTRNDTAYAVAFDRRGAIRWYRGFPAQPGEQALACAQQPNGHFTLFVGASTGWEPVAGRYYEFTPAGDSVATYAADAAYYTDPHELLLRAADSSGPEVYLLGYDLRSLDLTALGGTSNQLVAGHTILRQSVAGAVEFRWSAWDHFTLDDWVVRPPNLAQQANIDFDHPNSIALDRDGDYIVSFASLAQIVKIEPQTGALRWRFGGRASQFTLVDDPLDGFGIQHDVRLLPNGDLLFFDNGNHHNPPESRAVEYHLDTLAGTATLVWQYRHEPPVYAPYVGSVQRYRNGNTLVGFGAAGLMTEVGADGAVAWEGRLVVPGRSPAIFYRVRELPSLYLHLQP